MSKRNTVKAINVEYLTSCLAANGWSNTYFCSQLMGKGRGWITEWKRGKNLPSPEEAARMCLLLNTTPDEILTEPADIALVAGLIEREREAQGIKKDPAPEGAEVSESKRKLLAAVDEMTDEQCDKMLELVLAAKKMF